MRVALAQLISGRDVAQNLELVRSWTERAAAQGAELIVFPEATMRAFGHRLTDIAEPLDGPFATAVQQLAGRCDITIAVGIFTPGEQRRVRNTLLVAGPQGVLADYHKIHLFDAFGFAESDTVTPGTRPVVTTIGGTRVGWAVCYDIRFPNLFITLAEQGAVVTVVAASWGAGTTPQEHAAKLDQWRLLVRARALDSTCFIVAVGQADPAIAAEAGDRKPSSAPTGIGHSMVVAPDGRVLAELGGAAELRVIDIDPSQVDDVRAGLPVLANRRI